MCSQCEWERWESVLETMLDDDDYGFAGDTLEGIKGWVTEHQHVTPKQIEAIRNIEESIVA